MRAPLAPSGWPMAMAPPRTLTLFGSSFSSLITDNVWAEARLRYGYRDVRGVRLLAEFSGLPYVDVAASLTSFVPGDLDDGIAAVSSGGRMGM